MLFTIVVGLVLLVAGFFAPNMVLYQMAYNRADRMRKELPDALDLLTISVEAGLAFDAALSQVARQTEGPLAEEFFRVLQEMQIGMGRIDAFKAMAERTDVDEVRTFVTALVQADAFGIPIANVLRVQAKEMRIKRSPARRGGGPEGAGEDPLPADLLHPADAVRRRHRAGRPADLPRAVPEATVISIAVVTKRAGFTLTLHSAGHHFIEVRPAAGWLERSWVEDVLVLDLETAEATPRPSSTLRASGHRQPVIVVANDTDGWDGVIADHPDLFLVSLPMTPTVAAVDGRPGRTARARGPRPRRSPSRRSSVASVAARARPSGVAAGPAPDAGGRRPRRQRGLGPDGPRPVPAPSPRLRHADAAPRQPPTPARAPLQPSAGRPTSRSSWSGSCARSSVGSAGCPRWPSCCGSGAPSAVPCEASAVLVPDGEVWRVAAGDQLRPLEERAADRRDALAGHRGRRHRATVS